MNIKGLNFKCTCFACPEQYDVFDNDENIVGYIRLRWGNLTCEYPDVGGELIYCANIGDGWTGGFESEEQRVLYLNNIADNILDRIERGDIEDEDDWDDPWDDYDWCYECTGYGDDYSYDDDGELVSNCDNCPNNPNRRDPWDD